MMGFRQNIAVTRKRPLLRRIYPVCGLRKILTMVFFGNKKAGPLGRRCLDDLVLVR